MRRMGVIAGLLLSLGAAGALGQTMQSVRDDAKAFGTAQTAASQGVADSDTTVTTNVPGYTGPTAPQSSYMADPAALDASKLSVAQSNEGYRLTVDGNLTRPRISAAEVDATVARGNAINQDPNAIVQGLANGQAGQCTQLPPSTTTTGTFEASCNSGLALVTAPRSCPIALTHSFGSASHKYQCTQIHRKGAICLQGGPRSCTEPDFVDELVGSGCEAYDASTMCTTQVVSAQVIVPQAFNRPKTTYETIEAICSGDVAGTITGGSLTTRAGTYTPSFTDLGSTPAYQGSTQDVSQCTSLASDTGCTAPVDVCTDASPTTRTINGVAITQSCWAWSRTYSCTGTIPANDCSATTIPTGCTFTRDECLDDPAPADPTECKVHQRVYTCPITGPAAQTQYVCGGDVYCINGDCEPIVREASTEFKDAVVGLNSLGQAAKEFNSIDYTLQQAGLRAWQLLRGEWLSADWHLHRRRSPACPADRQGPDPLCRDILCTLLPRHLHDEKAKLLRFLVEVDPHPAGAGPPATRQDLGHAQDARLFGVHRRRIQSARPVGDELLRDLQ
jgi:conjugal transfer mating pair stabilization protein TraN